jgi:hypothetical protein
MLKIFNYTRIYIYTHIKKLCIIICIYINIINFKFKKIKMAENYKEINESIQNSLFYDSDIYDLDSELKRK